MRQANLHPTKGSFASQYKTMGDDKAQRMYRAEPMCELLLQTLNCQTFRIIKIGIYYYTYKAAWQTTCCETSSVIHQ